MNNSYYHGKQANYNMSNQGYQHWQHWQYKLQQQQVARTHTRSRWSRGPPKTTIKTPLDHTLLRNGVILWAHEPTPDTGNHPSKPFTCCRVSGGHKLGHYMSPGSTEEGDITLEIVPITSFGRETLLQTYCTTHPKRLASVPIKYNGSGRGDEAAEHKLLESLGKPLLGLESGETGRQLYLEVNHIYRVSLNQLHCYHGTDVVARDDGLQRARYVRLNRESYGKVREIFGLPADEAIFDKRVAPLVKRMEFNPLAGVFKIPNPPPTPPTTPELDEAALAQ
ncbi:hypothetical protein SBOR_7578 [Sclerotinia borealis F-4128]|uniref:Uncharacterized protein n=1 Tax=Sclerotinia borealis (strain F-4128) TaxID=1432307 RepID=W9C853_SCLBF|nr:hypothetical protein SBOR_7578 [Sclerotinia borealis F-4128]